jgi:AcrR family transcriptional regulator
MKITDALPAPRQTADERRDTIIDAAIAEFAVYGLHGTSTETIARRAGISQPYIFRLFGSKKELFLAALERVYDRIAATFKTAAAAAAAAATDGDVLEAMGHSYQTLLVGRDELFLLLQAFAASNDPEVRQVAHDRYAALYRMVAVMSGASEEALRQFFAFGMLCTVAAAIDLPQLLGAAKEEGWGDIAAMPIS